MSESTRSVFIESIGVYRRGFIWGVLQAIVSVWAAWQSALWAASESAVSTGGVDFGPIYSYFRTIDGTALWLILGLTASMTYFAREWESAFRTLILSQLIAIPLTIGVHWLFPFPRPLECFYSSFAAISPWVFSHCTGYLTPQLQYPSGIVAVGLIILVFFLGVIGVAFGSLLRDWLSPSRRVMIGWRLTACGLLLAATASFWPISQPERTGAFSWSVPIRFGVLSVAILAVLVIGGILCVTIGSLKKTVVNSDITGLLVIASVIVGALIVASILFLDPIISRASESPSFLTRGELPLLQSMVWLLTASLVIPGMSFLICFLQRREKSRGSV